MAKLLTLHGQDINSTAYIYIWQLYAQKGLKPGIFFEDFFRAFFLETFRQTFFCSRLLCDFRVRDSLNGRHASGSRIPLDTSV